MKIEVSLIGYTPPRPRRVVVQYWRKPIPWRHFDWEATLEDYDEGHHVGVGATEQDAITDLLELLAEDEPL